MKRIITLLLSIILVFSVMPPAALAVTEVNVVQPRYFRISTLAIDFEISSSGKSTCYCKVTTHEPTDTAELTMELQRLEDTGWKTIKTWTGSGTYIAYLNKNWYVVHGYDYQLKITAKIYDTDDTLLETQVDYSDPITY